MDKKYLLDTNVLKGNRIDDFDILIGVTAQQNNYTMVTANIKHLERIPDLNIENWEYE